MGHEGNLKMRVQCCQLYLQPRTSTQPNIPTNAPIPYVRIRAYHLNVEKQKQAVLMIKHYTRANEAAIENETRRAGPAIPAAGAITENIPAPTIAAKPVATA